MKKKNILLKATTISLALALTHCSPKESTRKRSFADGDFNESISQELSLQNVEEAARLEALLLEVEPLVVSQLSSDKADIDGPMLLQKVITRLKPLLLNKDYLTDPANRYLQTESGIQLIPRLVTLFNQAIILTYNSHDKLILNTDLLKKYKEVIFWDCDQDLKGSCSFIKFYRSADSNNMTYVMKMIHDLETNNDEKLRIVKAAYDIKNRRIDGPLRFMLLERIVESFKQESAGRISKTRLRQDADLFANILKINNIGEETASKYSALIKEINPWLLSRNIDDPKNPAMTDLIRIAGQELIYDGAGLSKEIQTAIDGLLYKVGPQFEQGVKFQKENIQGLWKDKFKEENVASLSDFDKEIKRKVINNPDVEIFGDESKKILTNLLKDVSFDKANQDEYFFLAHQVFYGHYNIDDAAAFWAKTKKDESRFMKATMDLIKMQIVNSIVFTNARMNNFYNNNKNTKLIELINESDKEASKIRKAWTKLIIRAKAMKSFANRVVVENTEKKRKELDDISKNVDALTKNIKFLVAYPNMFPIMHVMASLEMKDTIRTFFGTFTIDSQTVIDFFFAGRMPPFFNFGNDGNSLDSTEIIYSYYYALTTEIFETYSTNQVVKFSPEEFFKVVVKKLMLPGEIKLDDSVRTLVEGKKEFSNSIKAMQLACNEEKREQERERKIIEEREANGGFDWVNDFHSIMNKRSFANNQLSFTEIGSSIYDQTSNQKGKIGQYIKKVQGVTVSKNFDLMRTHAYKSDGVQSILLVQTLLDVYKTYNKGNQEEIDKIFKEQFEEYNRLKAEYTRTYLEMDKEIDNCEWTFLNRDRDLRHSIVFEEIKFLERLFDKMDSVLLGLTDEERANLSDTKKAEVEAVRKEFMEATQDEMFPQEYKDMYGYTSITPNRITTYKMDIYARLMGYLNKMFPGQYSITPPSNFKTDAIYKQSGAAFVYFDWTEKDREAAKKKFVSSGIKAFSNYVGWVSKAPEIDNVYSKAASLVSLYKLNAVSLDPEVDCSAIEESSDTFKNKCKKVSAAELIDYYKRILEVINIDQRDEIVLSLLGKESKYGDNIYHELIKKKDEHKLYSYYDLIFRRVISDTSVTAAEQTWFMGTLLKYVDSVHKRRGSTFIFPYPEEIEAIYIKNYKVWLDNYFSGNLEFIKEVKRQVDAGVEPFKFKYRMDRSHTVGNNATGRLNPLISNLVYGKFVGFTQQMDNDTSRYFSDIIKEHKDKIDEAVKGEE